MTTTDAAASSPEVTELLDRFQVKKQTVKHRLNDIVDDLFVDFVSEIARLSSVSATAQCPNCAAVFYNSNKLEPNTQQQQQQLPATSPKQHIESTLRSAQARAKDLIKEEFFDDSPFTRQSPRQSTRASLKRSIAVDNTIRDDDLEPVITLTPIVDMTTGAAANQPDSPLNLNHQNGSNNSSNNHNNNHSNGHGNPGSVHSDARHTHSSRGASLEEDDYDESEMECQCKECLTGVKSDGEDSVAAENGHSPKSIKAGHSSDSQSDVAVGEKSLEELNTLCGGLPYAKLGAKYICQFQSCGQELKSRHNLLLHQRAHLGIRPYRCKWDGCTYNSNQSSAVIRHIRTKHFQLPLTMREQQLKNIEDDRDPKDYLEVVATDVSPEGAGGSAMEPNDSMLCPPEPISVLQEMSENAENPPPAATPPPASMMQATMRTSRSATNGNKSSSNKKQSQSLLVPQQLSTPNSTNNRSMDALMELSINGGKPMISSSGGGGGAHHGTGEDDSDEDEYDSDENEFEVIPMAKQQHHRHRQQYLSQQQQIAAMQNAAALMQKQQQQAAQQHAMQQQQHQQNQYQQQPFGGKSSYEYARKRRLESKIFANANISNRNSFNQKKQMVPSGNGGGGNDYYSTASGQNQNKKPKSYHHAQSYSSSSVGNTPAQLPTDYLMQQHVPKVGPPPQQQQQYMFCNEEGCVGVFRTKLELDRHLSDVHELPPAPPVVPQLPQQQITPKAPSSSSSSSSSSKKDQNLYVCRWPNCPFKTMLHSSAINHVRGIHFNIPRTMTAAQRRMYANDTRNANDYIKQCPIIK